MKVLDVFVKAGTPEAQQLKAARFEDVIVRGVLPFLAGHLYLVAIAYQVDLHPSTAHAGALVAGMVAGILLFQSRPTGVLAAVGASSALFAVLFGLPAWMALPSITIAVLAYAFAVRRERIQGTSAGVFFLHVPVLSSVADAGPTELRVSVTMGALLVAAALLLARRRVAFAGAALCGGLLAAIVETEFERAPVYIAGLVALLVLGALAYEMRRERKTQSPLRRAVAQSLTVILLFVLSGLLTGWDSSAGPFVWLLLVVVVEGLQMILEGGRDVVRPVWPALALVIVLWTVSGLGDWRMRAALTCAVVGALHAYGLLVQSRFVAVVALVLTVVPAVVAFDQTEVDAFDVGGFAVQALITLTLLAQGLDPGQWRPEYRWWRGFIRRQHWRTLAHMSSMASRTLEDAPVIGAVFKGLRAAFRWVGYLNGGAPIRLHDVVYAAAHLYAAWTLGGQVTSLVAADGAPWPAAALAGQLAWIAWALGLLLYGELGNDALSRWVGLLLVCVPSATGVSWTTNPTDPFALWLLAATGAALTTYAAARRRMVRRSGEGTLAEPFAW